VRPADGNNLSASRDTAAELHSLASGVRFFVGITTVAGGLLDFNVCSQVSKYKIVFEEALPGKTLPFPTGLIIRFDAPWLVFSILLPLAGLAIIFVVRSHRTALISAALLIAGSIFQASVTTSSLFAPFLQMMSGISGNP
jgi:hypothetical protein